MGEAWRMFLRKYFRIFGVLCARFVVGLYRSITLDRDDIVPSIYTLQEL